MAEANKKLNIFKRIGRWFREMKSELKKVVWTSRSQMVNNTLVVIACVVVVGIFIWLSDYISSSVVQFVLNLVD